MCIRDRPFSVTARATPAGPVYSVCSRSSSLVRPSGCTSQPIGVVGPDGQVDDPRRREYLELHIGAVQEAIAGGADVRAYFVWSLLDNFEWTWGYARRFGLVHVDFATQRRTTKSSGRWYAEIAAGMPLGEHGGSSR